MRREFALPADVPAIVMTEEVAHPLERVWTARFEPLYVANWWRPDGYVNPVVELDAVTGGGWRISQRDPEGNEFSFYGVFIEVVPLERTEQSFTSELFADIPTRLTTEFHRSQAGTVVVTTHVYPSDEIRRGAIALGTIERMAESSDRFGELLNQLGSR